MDWQPQLGAWPSMPGVRFRVWAPERTHVDVVLERPGQPPLPHRLIKQSDGTFIGDHPLARVGDVYRYLVDGEGPYPDPASRFQPSGVHGPSQVVDPSSFHWTDAAWKGVQRENLILYELHVGSFTPEGTFEGVRRQLPHLVELGITAIELMPVADFPGQHNWGYDGVALFAPARCYGRPDDLRRLVDAAHGQGLAVLLDVVYNHFGPDGNYTGQFSPYYLTPRHETLWGAAVNFDGEQNERVREFFIQNALHWIHEYHLDGLRLDATHAILDESPRPFLADLAASVWRAQTRTPLLLIAEDNRNLITLVKPPAEGGYGLTAVWSDDFHHQLWVMLTGEREGYFMDFNSQASDLVQTLAHGWLYCGQEAPFFKGPRGTDPGQTPLNRFVFFIQNHDQIGNRAFGERLHHRIDAAAYRAASGLLLMVAEIPLLFMGQEWAASSPFLYFTDHHAELGRAVTEGRRREFKAFSSFVGTETPNPQAVETFESSRLVWSETLEEPHASVGLFYRALLTLRRDDIDPRPETVQIDTLESALIMKRASRRGEVMLILIQLQRAGTVDLSDHPFLEGRLSSRWDVLLTSEETAYAPDPNPPIIHLATEAPWVEFARPGIVVLKERLEPIL